MARRVGSARALNTSPTTTTIGKYLLAWQGVRSGHRAGSSAAPSRTPPGRAPAAPPRSRRSRGGRRRRAGRGPRRRAPRCPRSAPGRSGTGPVGGSPPRRPPPLSPPRGPSRGASGPAVTGGRQLAVLDECRHLPEPQRDLDSPVGRVGGVEHRAGEHGQLPVEGRGMFLEILLQSQPQLPALVEP